MSNIFILPYFSYLTRGKEPEKLYLFKNLSSIFLQSFSNLSLDNALDTDILQKLLQGCSIPHNVQEGSCEPEEEDGEDEEETDQTG